VQCLLDRYFYTCISFQIKLWAQNSLIFRGAALELLKIIYINGKKTICQLFYVFCLVNVGIFEEELEEGFWSVVNNV